jgi:hypothetical protein
MERAEPCTANPERSRAGRATLQQANASNKVIEAGDRGGAELNRWASSDASKLKPRGAGGHARAWRQDSALGAALACGSLAGQPVPGVKARHGTGNGYCGGLGGGERGEEPRAARGSRNGTASPRSRARNTKTRTGRPRHIHPSHTTAEATRQPPGGRDRRNKPLPASDGSAATPGYCFNGRPHTAPAPSISYCTGRPGCSSHPSGSLPFPSDAAVVLRRFVQILAEVHVCLI